MEDTSHDPPDDGRKHADRRADRRRRGNPLRNRFVLVAVLKVAWVIYKLVRLIYDWFGDS